MASQTSTRDMLAQPAWPSLTDIAGEASPRCQHVADALARQGRT